MAANAHEEASFQVFSDFERLTRQELIKRAINSVVRFHSRS